MSDKAKKLTAKIGDQVFAVGEIVPAEVVQRLLPDFYDSATAKPHSEKSDETTMSQFFKLDFSVWEAEINKVGRPGNVLLVRGDRLAPKHKNEFFIARTTGPAKARHPEADPAFRITDDDHSWILHGENFVKIN
jgi:hypothetical protein